MMHILAKCRCQTVLGSPFTVEIADPAVVTVCGDGLETGQSGQKAFFLIDTGQPTNITDVSVSVSRKSCR